MYRVQETGVIFCAPEYRVRDFVPFFAGVAARRVGGRVDQTRDFGMPFLTMFDVLLMYCVRCLLV